MTAPEAKNSNLAPSVQIDSTASKSTSNRPPRKDEIDNEGCPDHERATKLDPNGKSLEWAATNIRRERESKVAREILDTIEAETLRAARLNGGARRQIEVNRDQIAALLGVHEELKRPDEVYADEAWEICVIWRSEFGKVEISTEEEGGIGYFVSRTLSEENKEGIIQGRDADKLKRIFSWLEADPVDV